MVVWQRWRQFDTLLVGLLALGDLVGLTGILEGLRGRELVTDAPLPAEAAGRRFGQGVGTALLAALSARATGAFFRRGAGPEPAPLASEAPPPGGGPGWLARPRAWGQRAWQQLTGRGGAQEVAPTPRVPGPGAGGHGTASTFGDLSGMSRTEADAFLRSLNPTRVHTTRSGAYTEYRFADGSKVWIEEATGRVSRFAAPEYAHPGRRAHRINKGARLNPDGSLRPFDLPHDTGERVIPHYE